MRLLGLALTLVSSRVLADVEFTLPAGGDHVAVGTINVEWKESGIAPSIKDLTEYSLVLMVGGDEEDDMLPLATFVSEGSFDQGSSAQGTIPAGIAGPVTNGFFFKILSSSSTGDLVINYSNRFSITGLTGTTLTQYRETAEALNGSTSGPANDGDSSTSTLTDVASSTTHPGIASNVTNTIVTITRKPTTTVTSPPNAPSSPRSQPDGLSTSALVGVAVAGAAIGLLGVALAIWAFARRRRRKEQGSVKLGDDNCCSSVTVARKEMSIVEPVELDPHARIVEADNGLRRPEMDSMNSRAELEGDHVHTGILDRLGRPLTPVPDTPIENLTLTSNDLYAMSTDTLFTLVSPVTPRDTV